MARRGDEAVKDRKSEAGSAWDRVSAGAAEIVDRDHLRRRLEEGQPLRVKLGLDPTKPDLHLGHTVVLRTMRRFEDEGHTGVLIIGDWTARIGDPSGQNVTRPQLTRDEVNAAAETYLTQLWKILDEARTEVRYQSEWFDRMTLDDVVRLLGQSTVAKMLAREDFSRRFRDGRPIGLHELLYPLLQGYDSVAVKADVELGGTDQTFNLLVGRDLQQAAGQPPQDILTVPLLEGLDGVQKMSKSLDNYIGIDEPPDVMYRKAMSVPDDLIVRYLELATGSSPEAVRRAKIRLTEDENPRDVKKELALRLVTEFHGGAAATRASLEFERVVQSGELPSDLPEAEVSADEQSVASLFVLVDLADSKSEARRLAAQNGLQLNNEVVSDVDRRVSPQTGWILRRGRHRAVRLRVQ